MADLFDPSQSGGLMSFLTNPQTAGMLGLGGGLLAASGASRLPVTNGAALGMGLQGLQQGIGNAIQNQRGMLMMNALQGAMSPPQQASGPQGMPVSGAANTGPMSGVSAGMGGYAGYGGASGGSIDSGAPAGANIFGSTPQQLWQKGYALSLAGMPAGAEMMKMAAQYDPSLQMQMPTDAMKMAGAAFGVGTPQYQQALRNQVENAGAMSIRPGGGIARGNQISMIPQAVPGFVAVQDPNNTAGWTQVPIGNGTNAIAQSTAASAGATARAKAENDNQQVWDPTANNGSGGFVYQTRAAVNDASNGGSNATVPVGIRNNNFGGIKTPDGKNFVSYPTVQDGINAADANLAAYGSKHGINTITGIANRWSPVGDGDNNPTAKAAAIAAASGVPANQPINLQDPAMRARILPALFDTETPGWRNALQSGSVPGGSNAPAPAQGAPMAAQPPLAAGTYAQGQVQQMQQRWNTLRDQNASAQTVISQLQNISTLAPAAITGAEADKRAYVNGLLSLVGVPGAQDAKTATDLLDKYSNQIIAKLGQGGLGTDAARLIVSAGNPNAHMTVPAIQEAVRNLSGQYQMVQAKANVLQQYANSNNPAGYTKAETTFDQNADPRIWEYQSIQDQAARQKFAAGVLKQDPKFGQKIQALEQIGALQ